MTAGNSAVKEARRLSRRSHRVERRLFLAEGWKALAEAGDAVVEVFATPAAATEHAALLEPHRVRLVDERAAASLSDAVTPQGLVAVCRSVDRPLPDLLTQLPRLVVVCADIRDPGNAGTVIRTADAVGADLVVFAGESVDPHNPKTVRASVGSLWHVRLAVEPSVDRAVSLLREAGLSVLATEASGEVDLLRPSDELAGRHAWVFGNEAWGLRPEVAAAADHRVRIPIFGRAESLNLSTAVAVCLYASAQAHHRHDRVDGTKEAP